MSKEYIIKNSIRCNLCGDVIVSRHVHDFVTCLCGKVSADGGNEYLRRLGKEEDYTELSEFKGKES